MSRRSVVRPILARAWMPLVSIVAVSVGAVAMWKVHDSSSPPPVFTVNGPQAPDSFTQKRLTYQVFGTGSGAMLSYVDVYGHPHQADGADLPWSHTETTTLTVVSGASRCKFVAVRSVAESWSMTLSEMRSSTIITTLTSRAGSSRYE